MIGMKKLASLDFGKERYERGRGVLAVVEDGCLCLLIKKMTGEARYALDLDSLTYYSVSDGCRNGRSFFSSIYRPYNGYMYGWGEMDRVNAEWPFTDVDGRSKKALLEAVRRTYPELSANTGFYKILMQAEEIGRKTLYRSAADRKREREDALNSLCGGETEDFREWVMSRVPSYFLLSGDDMLRCTSCGHEADAERLKANRTYRCPGCGREGKVRKMRDTEKNHVTDSFRVSTIEKAGEGTAVVRYYEAECVSSPDGRELRLTERKRMFLDGKKERVLYLQKNGQDFRGSNEANVYERPSAIYPDMEGMHEALSACGRLESFLALRAIAMTGTEAQIGKFILYVKKKDELLLSEMLVKGRFYRLFTDASGNADIRFMSQFPHAEGEFRLPGILGLRDRSNADFLRQQDGGFEMLRWLREFERQDIKPDKETVGWLVREHLCPSSFERRPKQMSLRQAVNYIRRQSEEQYAGEPADNVLRSWYDYLSMCRGEDKDMDDEMVYRPRQLKKRHDQITEEINERIMREREASNREAAERHRAELVSKYPGAMMNLDAIRDKFSFGDEEYVILVPESLSDIEYEGMMLHHCVGTSGLYYEKIERNESYVCFLRHRDKPDLPYYTIEVEPGGTVRQSRSDHDGEPNIEEIRAFLRKWQKHIRQNMTEEDVERAAKARELGKLNVADRLARYGEGDRVYRALMEDFLEACDEEEETVAV